MRKFASRVIFSSLHIFSNQALTDKIPVKHSAKIQPPYESVAHSNGSSSTSSLS